MNKVTDSNGVAVPLGLRLGAGGEGAVYEVEGDAGLAAKLYHERPDEARVRKLKALVDHAAKSELSAISAWPERLLFDEEAQVIGFLMPRFQDGEQIHRLYGPRSRRKSFPEATWRFLVHVAANTARAVAQVHAAGCVVGDINQGGLMVEQDGTVRLIDCDGFQIGADGETFTPDVGMPTFTPPELQNQSLRGLERTEDHDNFGLAVLVFQLLFLGRHPFAGRFQGKGDKSIEQAIAERRFAYAGSNFDSGMAPPPGMPGLEMVGDELTALFLAAFPQGAEAGARPFAAQWVGALEAFASRLVDCLEFPTHAHDPKLDHCPICRLQELYGLSLFAGKITAVQRGPVDIDEIWARILSIEPPPRMVHPRAQKHRFSPSPMAKRLATYHIFRRSAHVAGTAALLYLIEAYMESYELLVQIPVFLLALAFWFIMGAARERKILSERVSAARSQEYQHRLRAQRQADDQAFHELLSELEEVRDRLVALPETRESRMDALYAGREQRQRDVYAAQFDIATTEIANFGPGRKAMLDSFGFETAGDIRFDAVQEVPGIGPVLARELLAWRKQMEMDFRFDAAQPVDPDLIAALDKELSNRELEDVETLIEGRRRLEDLKRAIIAAQKELIPIWRQAARVVAQAKVDKDHLGY